MEQLVFEIVILAVGVVVTVAAGLIARKLGKTLDIEIDDDAVTTAVLYAEEYARNYLKINGVGIDGGMKLDVATRHVRGIVPKYNRAALHGLLVKKIEAKVCELFHGPDSAPVTPSGSAPRPPREE